MDKLLDTLPVLIVPFLACLVIASLHCYMGLHVLRRGVIFVDLALAQCAALGAAVALFLAPIVFEDHHAIEALEQSHTMDLTAHSESDFADMLLLDEEDSLLGGATSLAVEQRTLVEDEEEHAVFGYCMSLLFALLGAILLSVGRFRDEAVPHEAIIGIIFVVCAALSVLILSKAPHGHDKMEAMLIGSILFVSWGQLTKLTLLYVALGVVHIIFRKRFVAISGDVAGSEKRGLSVKMWDILFFATFALMVTQSVGIAGVFVVFSYLIIPAACGKLLAGRFGTQLAMSWLVALITTVAGLALSALADMPTGSSLVSAFGLALVICSFIHMSRRSGPVSPSAA
jgi:zinc/manganese transport system permease protein